MGSTEVRKIRDAQATFRTLRRAAFFRQLDGAY